VPSEVRKGATVERLATELREKAQAARTPLATLTSVLRSRVLAAGVSPENAPRMVTMLSASVLVTELTAGIEPSAAVQTLATSNLRTSEAAVGRSISAAAGLASFLTSFEWDVLVAATALSDRRRAAAEQIGRAVAEALEADEHVIPLEARLREAQRNAFRLLSVATPSGGQSAAGAGGQADTVDGDDRALVGGVELGHESDGSGQMPEVLEQRAWEVLPRETAKAELDRLKSRLDAEPEAQLMISWRLTRDGGKG
jgi:hypothetical protein